MSASSVHSSQADVWYLKQITFDARPVKIITQNFNGPCSFIAICNILVLRRQIEILPHDRTTVSYEFLSQLVAEYLLHNCPDMDISAALSVLPNTTKGLDLNPQFTHVTAFAPAHERDLFAHAGIPLVHGWVVDPDSPEAAVMAQIQDYDAAVTLIADADYVTQGRLVGRTHADHADTHAAGPSWRADTGTYSDTDRRKIEQAIVTQQFLDATQSQLTYHGLFQLASTLAPGALVALFRNAHLSVVYKSPGSAIKTDTADAKATDVQPAPDTALYALVTDDVFLHEPTIVWERLEDVDGGWSTFVDAAFHRAQPVGGDVAGQTAEGALKGMEAGADQALARQLQAEEDARAHAVYQRRQAEAERRRDEQTRAETARRGRRWAKSASGKKKECVVM